MIRLLIAEDEIPLLRGMKNMVEKVDSDFEVVMTAKNGREAIDYLKENGVDVVFTDINMPIVDGTQVLRYVKENIPETQTVVISGYDNFSYAKQALLYGAKNYLLKPIDAEEFQNLLETLKNEFLKNEKENKTRQFVETIFGDAEESGIANDKHAGQELMKKVDAYIVKNITMPLSTKQLANEFGLVPPYLSRLFKQYKGVSPSQYILDIRMKSAKELLIHYPMILSKEVAQKVGFSNPLHFSKVFKNYTGIYPTEFQKKYKEK